MAPITMQIIELNWIIIALNYVLARNHIGKEEVKATIQLALLAWLFWVNVHKYIELTFAMTIN
jgi:branched-subunit amino acid ABC-type transport system permease component